MANEPSGHGLSTEQGPRGEGSRLNHQRLSRLQFLSSTEPEPPVPVREAIAKSWKRSRLSGLKPGQFAPPCTVTGAEQELLTALRSQGDRRGTLSLTDLPAGYRVTPRRLTLPEQTEYGAIVSALTACHGNKVLAANRRLITDLAVGNVPRIPEAVSQGRFHEMNAGFRLDGPS